jgi:hypothetical protein
MFAQTNQHFSYVRTVWQISSRVVISEFMQVKINLEETSCTTCQRDNSIYIDTAKYFIIKIYKLQKYCRVIYWEISKTHMEALSSQKQNG